jgi:hypothetical protein
MVPSDPRQVKQLEYARKTFEIRQKQTAFIAMFNAYTFAGDDVQGEKWRSELHVLLDAELDMIMALNQVNRNLMLDPPDC